AMRSPSTRTMAGARGAPPRPSTRRAALRTTTGVSAAALVASSAAHRTAARTRLRLLLDGLDRTAAGQETVEPRPHVLQIRRVAAADLGRPPTIIAHPVE